MSVPRQVTLVIFAFSLLVAGALALAVRLSEAAVDQVSTLYACVFENGTVEIRAYGPPCPEGQTVSFRVQPVP